MCLSSNHIAELFDRQYLCKKQINILVFVDKVSHQGKVASETTILPTFGWVWPVKSLAQSHSRINGLSTSLEKINCYLSFFTWS